MFVSALQRTPLKGTGFTGCGKTLVVEGYGLEAVRICLKTGPALAAEAAFYSQQRLFLQLLQPVHKPTRILGL
jgi:hypothetical protein